ncbi:hypothetical protein FS749_008071, partial [Ceratobasidium sp. UAMH 11750]
MSQPDSVEKRSDIDNTEALPVDQDQYQLQNLGYTPKLKRTLGKIESFASSFCVINFVGAV